MWSLEILSVLGGLEFCCEGMFGATAVNREEVGLVWLFMGEISVKSWTAESSAVTSFGGLVSSC